VTKLLPAIAVAATLGAIGSAAAQVYPSRPITMGMRFAAGGPGDTLARILADRMRGPLAQTVVVENITGAAGIKGE
jgi:tripartite-type tricarboxylate transporter receptor subunit TctC